MDKSKLQTTHDEGCSAYMAMLRDHACSEVSCKMSDLGKMTPIEELFAVSYIWMAKQAALDYGMFDAGLIAGRFGSELGYHWPTNVEDILTEGDFYAASAFEQDSSGGFDCAFLFSQVPVGQYRSDFVCRWMTGLYAEYPRISTTVAVECDGHEFHSRTKEQAQHDRARDRRFQELGLAVFRFTGSELYRDPFGCAKQVFDYMKKNTRKMSIPRHTSFAQSMPSNGDTDNSPAQDGR